MSKTKFYVVWEGIQPGVYASWAECQKQIFQFPHAKYKSYETQEAAIQAFKQGWKKSLGGSHSSKRNSSDSNQQPIDLDSICVDVGCSGNPGVVEYKGVDTRSGELLFYQGPIAKGTNNLGEFLAIVHALAYLHAQGSSKTIYTDSVTAMSWIRQKQVQSQLVRDESTSEIWSRVDRALAWLHTHSFSNKIVKWDTKQFGEIKADFGRKS